METILYSGKTKSSLPVTLRSLAGLLLLTGTAFFCKAQAQMDKRLVLAEKQYAAGNYYTAAGLYGQFLKPLERSIPASDFPLNSNRNAEGRTGNFKNRTEILLKQAESYRLAHYWTEAASLYKECIETEPGEYASALYWYAVCNRSLGNYAIAEEAIRQFLQNPDKSLQQAGEKEQQTLAFIKSQLTRPDTARYIIQKMAVPGPAKGVFYPLTSNSQFIFTSASSDSVTAGKNPYHNRLYGGVMQKDSINSTARLNIEGIDLSMNQGAACKSADGNRLFYTQWKTEGGKTRSSIYMSEQTATGWSKPVLVSINQSGSNNKQPFCTADGKYLYFASDREGGQGGFDIWYATLEPDGSFGAPVNSGPAINTNGNEQPAFYHNSTNILVFASDGRPGMGGYDLFQSEGAASSWRIPENLGYPVNSPRDEVYFYSDNKKGLFDGAFFSSDKGSECCMASYSVTRLPKKKILKGTIIDCENQQPLANAIIHFSNAAGDARTFTTSAEGQYDFAIGNEEQGSFAVSQVDYLDTTANMIINRISESDWQTDTVFNSSICLLKKKPVIVIENVVTIYFDFNRSNLNKRAAEQMDSILQVMQSDSLTVIQVSGYTDGLGSATYNAKLSDMRSRSCADYLIEHGIDPARIRFEAFGSCCPVEMELINGRDNPGGRSMNRRAMINIIRI